MKIIKIIEEGRMGGPQIDITLITPVIEQMGITSTVIMPKEDSYDFQMRLKKEHVSVKTIRLTRPSKNPKHLLLYEFTFFAESILSNNSSGITLSVSKCFAKRANDSFCQTQFSSICDGASTKSRATDVPA